MIRDEISKILGVRIEEGGWKRVFRQVDLSGGINQKTLMEMVLIVLEHLDEKSLQSDQKPVSSKV